MSSYKNGGENEMIEFHGCESVDSVRVSALWEVELRVRVRVRKVQTEGAQGF